MFPTIERVAAREAVVLHEAHRHIRKRLRELGGSLFEHVVRRNLVRDFIEELRAHAAHEKRMLDLWTN